MNSYPALEERCRSEQRADQDGGCAGRTAKKPKGSQEAHEPIRPALSDGGGRETFTLPKDTPLAGRELRLYEMIFQRTLASVMVDAQLDLTTGQPALLCCELRGAGCGLGRASG